MGEPIFHVDAFTDRPFSGNPAAVCVLSQERDDAWLQQVAREMNLSETAFLRRAQPGWQLRWFTPKVEVDLCGHATLASAHVLWEAGYATAGTDLLFQTASGRLGASRRSEGEPIELDFPAEPASTCPAPPDLLSSLGVAAASGGPPHDFVSRYFAPGAGIDEDPVTGSAHCCLGPFWAARLGKNQLFGYQASARGGTVAVRVGDSRVFLGGRAVTVACGELL